MIVGIPSADVAEPHHLEITHETQYNFWQKPAGWNSFNFACYGVGFNTELTASFNNLNNQGSTNMAVGVGFKNSQHLFKSKAAKWEIKWTWGTNVLFSTRRQEVGGWAYGHLSTRLPVLKTRLTGGISYGSSQAFGFRRWMVNGMEMVQPRNPVAFIGGFEQPIYKNISLIGDWYSGTHDLAAFIPAIQIDVRKHVLIFGYKIPNNAESGGEALILEAMLSIPTRKQH